jgi:hypothetical protein
MELAIPLVALGGLYVISNQSKSPQPYRDGGGAYENFQTRNTVLPNTDVPNVNYPSEFPVQNRETDLTSKLSTVNMYDTPKVYTDKYFNPYVNNQVNNPFAQSLEYGNINQLSNTQTDTRNAQYQSLTGEKVDGSYFKHNNMTPFFGSKLRNVQVSANSNESILDNYQGQGSQIIIKREQSPLFSPETNYQWATGAPNQSDFIQSRMNVSTKMSNVKPFTEERVRPGLGAAGESAGFNSGMMEREMWLPKTADQMRVDNKPKASGLGAYGYEGPAMSYIPNQATAEMRGRVEKHSPDTVYENTQDRWFTTTGMEKGYTMHAIPVERHVNRPETTTDYGGAAKSTAPALYASEGEYMPSKHIDLGQVPIGIANANGRNLATETDYGAKTAQVFPNNRSANKPGDYFGAIGTSVSAAIAPLLDIMRPSRKENTIGTLRPYQNPGTTVPQSYIFNPADKAPTTIRETTEESIGHTYVNANQHGGAYEVSPQQVANTYRQQTSDYMYVGASSAGDRQRGIRPYDSEYSQTNNDNKSSVIQNTGYTPKGGMSLMQGDINMMSKPTEAYLVNRRDLQPTMPVQTPSASAMGRVEGANQLYAGLNMDRNVPDIMTALQTNPYVVNYPTGGL